MTNKLQNKKNLIILCLRTMDMYITNYTTDRIPYPDFKKN